MAANRIFLGIVLLGITGGTGMYRSSGIKGRNEVLRIARAEVGVREATGRNDGKRIAEYLAYTGIKVPAPYCAAYVSFCFWKAGYPEPRTAWSPAMFPASRIVKAPRPADLFGLYYPSLKRIGHVGFVEQIRGDFLQTLEANTNAEGSREGQGVYRRMRHKRTIYKYSDWYGKMISNGLNTVIN